MRRVANEKREVKRQRGMVMVFAAGTMVILLLFAALAIDIGFVWSSRTQSQAVADSAALAAGAVMIDPAGPSTRIPQARAEATDYAANNSTVANASVNLAASDIVFGNWNVLTRTFDPNIDTSNPNEVTAVQVDVVMDDTTNVQSPTYLTQLLGRDGFTVRNTAIAYLGFEGSWDPGEFELPIAIDSCDLVSDPSGCGTDFCETVANPPNACPLDDPQAGDGDVTCLEFSSTPEQNACWTQFDEDHPSINSPGLENVIDNGNPNETESGDEVYLDNGDKTSVQKHLYDKFYGEGDYAGNPSGTDRYPPHPGRSDSWVVKLPVMECQTENKCAGGEPQAIIGGVCFEIREITGPPEREIRGRFLCPTDPDPQIRQLYEDHCAGDPDDRDETGGCNFGERAQDLVLVK